MDDSNNPWWVAKDVCGVLGLSNPTIALKSLDIDEVTKFNLGGQYGEANAVNEPGLYTLVLKSRKPEAKKFKRWVTHEVLPTIRKTGAYALKEMSKDDQLVQLAEHVLEKHKQVKLLEAKTADMQKDMDDLVEQVEEFDDFVEFGNPVCLRTAAKAFFQWLGLDDTPKPGAYELNLPQEEKNELIEATVKDLVIVSKNNQPITTSLKVSEVFKKAHKHVIKRIETLDCSGNFFESNFRLKNYSVKKIKVSSHRSNKKKVN